MNAPTPSNNRFQDKAEIGLLIAVIAGTVIAVNTQQIAWGLIPSAIALVVNKFNRRQEQRSQYHKLQHLETLIERAQGEQENQQILLWQVKEKAEAVEQALYEFQEQQTQDKDSLKQVEKILEKQNYLEQQQQELEKSQSRLESDLKTNFSTKEQVKEVQNYLKQMTELLNSLVKFQAEQSQTMASKLSELQLKE